MGKKSATAATTANPKFGSYIRTLHTKGPSGKSELGKMTISSNAVSAAEQLIDHFVDILSTNAELVVHYGKNGTLKVRHVAAATDAAMSGSLASDSLKAGYDAVLAYEEAIQNKQEGATDAAEEA